MVFGVTSTSVVVSAIATTGSMTASMRNANATLKNFFIRINLSSFLFFPQVGLCLLAQTQNIPMGI